MSTTLQNKILQSVDGIVEQHEALMYEKQYRFLVDLFSLIDKPVPSNWKTIYKFPSTIDIEYLELIVYNSCHGGFVLSNAAVAIYGRDVFYGQKDRKLQLIATVLYLQKNSYDEKCSKLIVGAYHKEDIEYLHTQEYDGAESISMDKIQGIGTRVLNLDIDNMAADEVRDEVKRIREHVPHEICDFWCL